MNVACVIAAACGIALAAPPAADSLLFKDEHGQTDVNLEEVETRVRACWAEFDAADESSRSCASETARACMEEDPSWGTTTVGMSFCLQTAGRAWKTIVNETFAKLGQMYQIADALDGDRPARGHPFRLPTLEASQGAWEVSHEADCNSYAMVWRGGTGAGPRYSECLLKRRQERAYWLGTLIWEESF